MNVCCNDIKRQNVISYLSERICFGVYLDMKHAETSVVKECKATEEKNEEKYKA
jgi:hypothetical protein